MYLKQNHVERLQDLLQRGEVTADQVNVEMVKIRRCVVNDLFALEKQARQVAYSQFAEIVKRLGYVIASPSHSVTMMSSAAILVWRWDEDNQALFCVTTSGSKVECPKNMPGFYIYDIVPTS